MSKKTEKKGSGAEYEEYESYERKNGKPSAIHKAFTFLFRLLLVLMETVLLAGIALYSVMFVLAKGPSPTAGNLFVMSVRETSAIGFLANLFFTEEEIARIEASRNVDEYVETDTSLININMENGQGGESAAGPQADAWGLVDEDGDGIIVEPVKGEGYSGYMMVVLDPSRVIMGSIPESFGGRGYTVEQMVKEFDAVAGINAGGFDDPNGQGDGSIPDSLVVVDGEIYYAGNGYRDGFVGFDSNYIMHVGRPTTTEIREKDIRYGVCFGPVLISNGVPADPDVLSSGLNPRTAIGQRSDGAVLMLVIDGRQAHSIGATYADITEVMLDYGAVNACNLDGGSSTTMWYDGDYVNSCSAKPRNLPTCFLVRKEGAES